MRSVNSDQTTIIGLGLGVLGVLGALLVGHGLHGVTYTVIGTAAVVLLVTGAMVLHHAGYLRSIAERRARRRAEHEGTREHGSAA